jgi:nucleoid DNA-binding protein
VSNLLAGNTVQLGDWGSFFLTVNSSPSDTKEEVTGSKVYKINIRFQPGRDLQESINKAQFKPVESLSL